MPTHPPPSSIEYRFHAPTSTLPTQMGTTLLYRIPSLEHTTWTHFRVHYFNGSCNELVEDEPRIRLARASVVPVTTASQMITIEPFGRARGTRHFRAPIQYVDVDGGDLYLVIANPVAEVARIVLRLYGTTASEEKT